jgi:hypothetical protein
MKKCLEVTPEWVLERIPHTHYADGKGNISVYTGDATDANWIELALNTLNVLFEAYDYLDRDYGIVFGFDFRIEDIKEDCPSFYKRVKDIDANNVIDKNLTKN